MLDYTILKQAPRLLLTVPLKVAQGARFQPTGFADLGAAEFSRPDGKGGEGIPMLLVESAQSMANRLEKTCVDGDGPEIAPELAGLPYVITTLKGTGVDPIRTSSLVEAHRLASPYFVKTEFGKKLAEEMGYTGKGPLDWKKIYACFFRYDPNCLIHGVFLSLIHDGRVRVPRALTGFIEAEDVRPVVSGGVKNSPVDPKGEIMVDGDGGEKGVYSNVPYSRVEYTAARISAYFNLDLGLIRGYGLGEDATNLLVCLALLKMRRFLSGQLRLRTACHFVVDAASATETEPRAFVLPEEAELVGEVQRLIGACAPLFTNPAVTQLETPVKFSARKEEKAAAAEA